MGHYTYLVFGDYATFEAKNCLPLPWLALFAPGDYTVDIQQEDDVRIERQRFVTSHVLARQRVTSAIDSVRGKGVSAYLRPLLVLDDVLSDGAPDAPVVLDGYELIAIGGDREERFRRGPARFARMLGSFTGDLQADLQAFNEVFWGLPSWVPITESVADMDPEERMFVLLGWYEGDPKREAIYSLDHFKADFWQPLTER
jgi:hypothetical protein